MIKVDQTIVSGSDEGAQGNCLQAVVASLFELELEEVPHFIMSDTWYTDMAKFYSDMGKMFMEAQEFEIMNVEHNGDIDGMREALEHDGGIGGYWGATVKSQTFEGKYHAVVIDRDMNIVHDPNPNRKSLKLGPGDLVSITTVKPDWYFNTEGKLIILNTT